MPHEKINYPTGYGFEEPKQAVVAWNGIGWVQLSIYPMGWKDTGDAFHVPLTPPEIDKLIKTLKRAKRQAYRAGNRHSGYSDRRPMPEGSDLFPTTSEEK